MQQLLARSSFPRSRKMAQCALYQKTHLSIKVQVQQQRAGTLRFSGLASTQFFTDYRGWRGDKVKNVKCDLKRCKQRLAEFPQEAPKGKFITFCSKANGNKKKNWVH